MPWRGPNEPGEFPTLGYEIGEWIESHCVIPDGWNMGQPFLLTDEMWRFLINYFRLYPHAAPFPAEYALRYTGGQLRRSQKWGKDPFGASITLAKAFGPSTFAGWDANGEPVGRPYPTPLIVLLGTSEDQTDNTWLPLLSMIRNGPLIDLPGIDAGQTRVLLPGGGKIEPATTSARARLGAPMTHVNITESHLFTLQGGYRRVCANVKRNVAGMDGTWLELTNAYDPTELSEAQVTAESGDERVYVDNIESHRVEDLQDDDELYRELLRQYGDSARERGGWVNIRGRIFHEVRSNRYSEADRRRYFLNEIVVGEMVLVDPVHYDAQALPPEMLGPKEPIALGFDGSKYRDATALIASRMSDGRQFCLKIWERPEDADRDWRVPSAEVDTFVRSVFGAYTVTCGMFDPYRWQDYIDKWIEAFGSERVIEFPTNQEQRMDKAIERFQTAFANGEIKNDGNPVLALHFKNAVLVKGSRKKVRPGEQELATHYLKLAKRADGLKIDGAVAGVLAHEARAWAIEHDLMPEQPQPFFGAWRG